MLLPLERGTCFTVVEGHSLSYYELPILCLPNTIASVHMTAATHSHLHMIDQRMNF